MKKGGTFGTMVATNPNQIQKRPPMNYVGIDYHKKYSQVTVIDDAGHVIRSQQLLNNPEYFKYFSQNLG